jgi:hypothetical protein
MITKTRENSDVTPGQSAPQPRKSQWCGVTPNGRHPELIQDGLLAWTRWSISLTA